jgi:segregation and condensation protein B
MTLKNVIEALVFGSPKPIQAQEISATLAAAGSPEASEEIRALVATKPAQIEEALVQLREEHIASARGFQLVEQVNGWTFVTNPEAAPWVKQLYPEAKPTRLSGPALETLAIIAYRQPVTRADVEAVRGVAVDGVMQVLLDRSLVKITGRADLPGRPLLYGTTEYFLQHFGLRNTEELPNSEELKRVALPTAPVAEEPEPATKPAKGKKGAKEPEQAAAEPELLEVENMEAAPVDEEAPDSLSSPESEELTETTESSDAPASPSEEPASTPEDSTIEYDEPPAPAADTLDTPPDEKSDS